MESEGKKARSITAMWQFEREMDALMPPVMREELMEATKRLLIGMFDFSARESATRTNILAERIDIPGPYELEQFPESLPEILKLGLVSRLAEEYIILFGKEEFDKWIDPFIRLALRGHIEESASLEHWNECPEDRFHQEGRFCPAPIIVCEMNDRLRGNPATIDKNEVYIAYPNEIIHMNTSIIRILHGLGLYSDVERENLLDDYRWWLEMIDDSTIDFDRGIFES